MGVLEPIRNHILFQFEDEQVQFGINGKTHFREKTEWGFELGFGSAYDSTTKRPRWGKILYVGKEVPDYLRPGMLVLIDALKWTSGVQFKGEKFWRTDSNQILAVYT